MTSARSAAGRALPLLATCTWLFASLASVQPCGAQTAAAPDDGGRGARVVQKARLIEQLLASPRAREVGGATADGKAALARAGALLAESRSALESGDAARAETAVDEALKVTTAAIRAGGGQRADGGSSERNAELREQVAAYRNALAAAQAGRSEHARAAPLTELDRLVADAQQASAAGRHGDANRSLAQAYRIAVTALTDLRAGETVRIELKFDTPADEFAYEQKRFRSHEMLVDIAMSERAPTAEARSSIERELAQARAVRARAEARAAAADHAAAIGLMEEATGHLVRALQSAGVPVFR